MKSEAAMSTTFWELLNKSIDAHSPAPKIHRGEAAGPAATCTMVAQAALAANAPVTMAQIMESLRTEMNQIAMANRSDMLDMQAGDDGESR